MPLVKFMLRKLNGNASTGIECPHWRNSGRGRDGVARLDRDKFSGPNCYNCIRNGCGFAGSELLGQTVRHQDSERTQRDNEKG